jgi:hypothetical protein
MLPQDLWKNPTLFIDSMWWDRPSYEPNVWRCSGLLSYDEYNFDAPSDAIHHVPWPMMELEDLLVSVEEYFATRNLGGGGHPYGI